MKLRPLLDKVVIKRVEAQETTKAGIILPGSAQEKPGGMVDGKEVVMTLKVGEKVIAAKYSGTSVKLEGEEYTVISQSEILAVVE